jgi:uncharacterized protein involved in outer membrane biogenesis
MGKLLIRIIKLAIWVLILTFATIIGIVIFVNPNEYKAQIASLVEKHSDYKIQLSGNLKWSVWPQLSIYCQNIIITKKQNTEKLLEAQEAKLLINPIEYILNKVKNKTLQTFALNLKAIVFYGLNTKVNLESMLNIDFVPNITVLGNIKLLPIEYQNNSNIKPLTINVALDSPKKINLSIDEPKIDMAMVSKIFVADPLFSGTGDIKVNLNGLLNNLTGNIDLAITDGKLQGIDISNVLTQTENNLNSLFDLMRGNIKQTIDALLSNNKNPPNTANLIGDNYFSGFSKLTINAIFKDGVSSQAKLTLQHPTYNVNGDGTINLTKNLLDYKINATLNKIENNNQQANQYITSVPILIKVTGTINDPQFSVDTKEYLQTALQALQKNLFSKSVGAILN